LIAKDRGFWNWYCKRLLADSKFKRDVVARKTFSKLRGAIAGLYAARGHFEEAELAFKQAVDLYPLSPEANFRLADVYLARGRYQDARKIIQDFLVGDPKNDKIREFLGFIDGVEGSSKRIEELERQVQDGRMEINSAVELVTLYRRLNRWPQFDRMMQDLLAQTGMPPPVYLQLGRLAYEAQRIPLLDAALVRYTALQPNDPNGWVELGGVRLALGKPDDAMMALQNAVRAGGQPVRDQLRQDNRFGGLHQRPDFQQLVAPQIPQGPVQLPGTLKDLLR
jgi:predicted Zn-dependent protease